jgi:hypothetical protein
MAIILPAAIPFSRNHVSTHQPKEYALQRRLHPHASLLPEAMERPVSRISAIGLCEVARFESLRFVTARLIGETKEAAGTMHAAARLKRSPTNRLRISENTSPGIFEY